MNGIKKAVDKIRQKTIADLHAELNKLKAENELLTLENRKLVSMMR